MGIRTRIISAAAAVIIAGTGALGVVAAAGAQEEGQPPAAERQARREAFLSRIAEKLGVTLEGLRQAVRDAAIDAVNEAEAEGRITSEQADKARQRIEEKGIGGLLRQRQERIERLHRLRAGIIESSAAAIGIDADALKAELKAGASIAEVAAEEGVALDDVKARIIADAQAKADDAVAAGRIDEARADELLAKLTERLDELLNRKRQQPAA